jgi:hypothetical protein
MSAKQQAVQFDVLTLDGAIVPPGGEGERYRLAFPPSAMSTDSNSGENIQQVTPYSSAVMTVSCFQTDPVHDVMLAFYARQQAEVAAGGGLHPGSAGLSSKPGATVVWAHAYVTQQAEIVSSLAAQVVTWTLTVTDVVRQGM